MNDKLSRIRMLVFDVDGVLTDNGLWVSESGETMKRFDIRDGLGMRLAIMAGLQVGLLSGHASEATRQRAEQLGLTFCRVGVRDKLPVFRELLAEHGRTAEETLYMGDDFVDVPVLRAAGVAVTVPEAPHLVKEHCDVVAASPQGRGAVREIVESVLTARGLLDDVLARFLT